jgi:hypothetical protein
VRRRLRVPRPFSAERGRRAIARARGTEALADAGRRVEADVQLQRALAFYRSVGATAYIWEAESLFAASAEPARRPVRGV